MSLFDVHNGNRLRVRSIIYRSTRWSASSDNSNSPRSLSDNRRSLNSENRTNERPGRSIRGRVAWQAEQIRFVRSVENIGLSEWLFSLKIFRNHRLGVRGEFFRGSTSAPPGLSVFANSRMLGELRQSCVRDVASPGFAQATDATPSRMGAASA